MHLFAWTAVLLASTPLMAGEQTASHWPVRIELDPEPYRSVLAHGLPALAADGRELALFDAGDPMGGNGVGVVTVRVPERTILHRFELVAFDEEPHQVREQLLERFRAVNNHLAERGFQALPSLFEFGQSNPFHCERPAVAFGWYIERDDTGYVVTVSDLKTGQVQLHLSRPVRVLGPPQGHPANHCWFRGQPRQGWFDEGSGLALIRMNVAGGGHYCDRPDEWLITPLSP